MSEHALIPAPVVHRLRDDPLRIPEELVLAAAERMGPAAQRWVDETAALYGRDPATLATMAKRKHAGWARAGGAAMGFGGFVTVLPDLAGLAWLQARLVLCVAAAYGFDPTDRMRPAELLVIQGLYEDPVRARAALDGEGPTVVEELIRSRLSRDQAIMRSLLILAGKQGGKKVAGKLIPGFAVAFNAITNERDTRAVADRAIRFYGG